MKFVKNSGEIQNSFEDKICIDERFDTNSFNKNITRKLNRFRIVKLEKKHRNLLKNI